MQLQIAPEPMRTVVACPDCGADNRRLHSRYRRRPWDVPWGQQRVQLVVDPAGSSMMPQNAPGASPPSRGPGVVAPYAWQTKRWRQAMLALAHASGAEMAARVGELLGYRVSPDSLIHRQRPKYFVVSSWCVLGVDECALRRARTYGMLRVDLEWRQPVVILKGHMAEPLSKWLLAHPTVAILVRVIILPWGTGQPASRQELPASRLAQLLLQPAGCLTEIDQQALEGFLYATPAAPELSAQDPPSDPPGGA